jgi:hypothetical protein
MDRIPRLVACRISPKELLHNGPHLAVKSGVEIVLPTADDITARFADGKQLINISIDAMRLQPFLGEMFTPSDRRFVRGVLWSLTVRC